MSRIFALLYPGWAEAEGAKRFQVIAVLVGALVLWMIISVTAFAIGIESADAKPAGRGEEEIEIVSEPQTEMDLTIFTGIDMAGLTARQRERLRSEAFGRGLVPRPSELIDKTPPLSAGRWEAGYQVGYSDLEGHQATVVVELPPRNAQELTYASPEPPTTGAVQSITPVTQQSQGVMAEGEDVIQPFRPSVGRTDPMSGGPLVPRPE